MILEEFEHNENSQDHKVALKPVQIAYEKLTSIWQSKQMPTLEEIEDKITDLGNELEELKHEVGSMQSKEGKFWGRAFIIFDSQIEAEHAGKLKLIY